MDLKIVFIFFELSYISLLHGQIIHLNGVIFYILYAEVSVHDPWCSIIIIFDWWNITYLQHRIRCYLFLLRFSHFDICLLQYFFLYGFHQMSNCFDLILYLRVVSQLMKRFINLLNSFIVWGIGWTDFDILDEFLQIRNIFLHGCSWVS